MEQKPWYLSKTIWMNIIMGLSTAFVPVLPFFGSVGSWISANGAMIGVIWAGLGIFLRTITKGSVVLRDEA